MISIARGPFRSRLHCFRLHNAKKPWPSHGLSRRHVLPLRRLAVASLFIWLILALAASSVSAKEYTAGHKFRRGFSYITLGVLAIPGQMTVKSRESGYAVGLPLGFIQGVGWFITTEIVGVWEFLTCPFEFPPRFRPIIEPEYPWDYFKRRNPGAGLP